jgi:hypothetical protein
VKRAQALVLGEALGEALDRHPAAERAVLGHEDLAHAAPPDEARVAVPVRKDAPIGSHAVCLAGGAGAETCHNLSSFLTLSLRG